MGKITTKQDMTKRVAKEVMSSLEVNDMSLEEFIIKVDGVAEFLKSELRICSDRFAEEPSPYYDGVDVGFANAKELTVKHMVFCKRLLDMMNFEQ